MANSVGPSQLASSLELNANLVVGSASAGISGDKIRQGASTSVAIDGVTSGGPSGTLTGGALLDGSVITRKLGIGSVTATRIADGSVVGSKIANGAVSPAKLSAGGTTPTVDTVYHGDGTWRVPAGGSGGGFISGVANTSSVALTVSGGVLTAQVPAGGINPSRLFATAGTPSASTFYRGDGQWAAFAGLPGVFNVKDFGAVGSGSSDDTAGITAAITAAAISGGVVYVPPGFYGISSTIFLESGVKLAGAGLGSTFLIWIGPGGGTLMRLLGNKNGSSITDMTLGGRPGSADSPFWPAVVLRIGSAQFCEFKNLVINRFSQYGIWAQSETGLDCAWNNFQNININSFSTGISTTATGLFLNGGSGAKNVCHCTFTNISIFHSYIAFRGDDADNNCFTMLFCFKSGPTAQTYEVQFGPVFRGNYFYHIQAAGLLAETPAETGLGNSIFGFDRENGQPAPVAQTGATLWYTEHSRNSSNSAWVCLFGSQRYDLRVNTGAGDWEFVSPTAGTKALNSL